MTDLEIKIKNKSAKIAVIGLGYVGLPLAYEFARRGFNVAGIDTDKDRIDNVKKGIPYILDVDANDVKKLVDEKIFLPATNYHSLKTSDCIIICVPTPLKRKTQPNIGYIKNAVKKIKKYLRKGHLVILESTTYPGTTDEVILPLLESTGLKCGIDFCLVFSPERIDPGNEKFPVNKIPKVAGGVTSECSRLFKLLYENIIEKVVVVSSPRAAEAVKLLENTYRLINIGLVNELAMMCHKMNLDIWEIVDAAKTKPFGFMPFYPGPGVGGHCIEENQTLYIRRKNDLEIVRANEFINGLEEDKSGNIEVLSFDPIKKTSVFKKIITASVRPYKGKMVEIVTDDGRHIKVTDLHPMFIFDNGWRLRYAKDINKGDSLPICLKLPDFSSRPLQWKIDLIKELRVMGRTDIIERTRIKPIGFHWRAYEKEIKSVLYIKYKERLPDALWEWLSDDYLPLEYFYDLVKIINVDRSKLNLVSGRGPGYSEMPAMIYIDADFCRLIGYYLSEGCFTKDKSARIRFTFNRQETEYIDDLRNILNRLNVRTSIYNSNTQDSCCIKVSSNIFGFLIKDVLKCGTNCYNMAIPQKIFAMDINCRRSLVSGLLRGDGCVEHFFGKWRYRRNEKIYLHNVNTAHISYFTSSQKLFRQFITLLHDLNIIPTFRRRKYSISIFGYKQLSDCKDLFAGKKREIIEKYLELNKNRIKNKTFVNFGNFATVKVKSVNIKDEENKVYSIETEKPHTFVSSYGVVVHNCIPKDPLYLYWKAKLHGFKSRFIKLASDLNSAMPAYIVSRLKERISLKDAKIMVLGVTYKKDVKDLRKSPALEIIGLLHQNQAEIFYHDPLIPYLKFDSFSFKSLPLDGSISDMDCVLIASDHGCIDYDFVLKEARLVFDTRNVYKGIRNEKLMRL